MFPSRPISTEPNKSGSKGCAGPCNSFPMSKKILVVCLGNACRSQMAEGYLRYYTNGFVPVASAGIRPGELHPLTVEVMEEDGIDMSGHYSKGIDQVDRQEYDYVISVCDEAQTALPIFPKGTLLLHRHFPDPAGATGTRTEQLQEFRQVREQIKKYVLKFVGKELQDVPIQLA